MLSSPSAVLRRLHDAVSGSSSSSTRSSSGSRRRSISDSRVRVCGEYASWVRGMAQEHNCGSVNKTLRDLISWYGRLDQKQLRRLVEGWGRRSSTGSRASLASTVTHHDYVMSEEGGLEAGLTREHVELLAKWGKEVGLGDRELVLERLIEHAMMELDDEVLFESGLCLPQSTAALYSDLNIYSELLNNAPRKDLL